MVRAGYSPSVRLFEAAACGTPILSDSWPGLDEVFHIGREIVVANTSEEALEYVRQVPAGQRTQIGDRARTRVLAEHASERRAEQLGSYAMELVGIFPRAQSSGVDDGARIEILIPLTSREFIVG